MQFHSHFFPTKSHWWLAIKTNFYSVLPVCLFWCIIANVKIVKFHKNNTKKIERNHCHFVGEKGEAHLMATTVHFWFKELFFLKAETFLLKMEKFFMYLSFNGNKIFLPWTWKDAMLKCADTKNGIYHQSLSRSMQFLIKLKINGNSSDAPCNENTLKFSCAITGANSILRFFLRNKIKLKIFSAMRSDEMMEGHAWGNETRKNQNSIKKKV